MRIGDSTSANRNNRIICLPFSQDNYDKRIELFPELFPAEIVHGYQMKDIYRSKKQSIWIRRIEIGGVAYTVRPSFIMPYLLGYVDEIEAALFLRKSNVPFWAVSYVFGKDPMYTWQTLFPAVVIICCFLHVFIKTRDRANRQHCLTRAGCRPCGGSMDLDQYKQMISEAIQFFYMASICFMFLTLRLAHRCKLPLVLPTSRSVIHIGIAIWKVPCDYNRHFPRNSPKQ